MTRRLLGSFCIAAVLAAQIGLPRIGFVQDRKGALRPLLGVSGAFVLGDPVLTGVVASASFGSEYAVAHTGSELVVVKSTEVVWRGETAVAEAFGFRRDGRPAWVRFVTGGCLVWPEKGDPAEVEPSAASFCEKPTANLRTQARIPDSVTGDPSSVAPGWILLRSPERLFLASTTGTEHVILEVPEVEE